MQRVGLGDRGDVDDEVAVFPDVDEGVFEGESVGAGLQADRQYRRGTPDDGGERDGGEGARGGGRLGGGPRREGEKRGLGWCWPVGVVFGGLPGGRAGGSTLPIRSL